MTTITLEPGELLRARLDVAKEQWRRDRIYAADLDAAAKDYQRLVDEAWQDFVACGGSDPYSRVEITPTN